MLGKKVKMVKNGAQPFEDLRPCSAGWEEMIGRGTPESRRPPLSCGLVPWAKATAQPLRDIQGQPGWEPGSGQGSILLALGVMAQDQPGGSRPGPSCGLSGWWVGQRNSHVCLQTRCRVTRRTQPALPFLGAGPSVRPAASLTSVSRHLQGQVGGDNTQVSPDPPFPHLPDGQ